MKTAITLSLQPFVFLDLPAFFLSALSLGLADEVPDLGCDALTLGRAHARRVLGYFLGHPLHLLAQLGAARLGLGIEVRQAGDLDEFFLRLLEARDRIALLGFGLPGARGLHPAPLCIVEG